MKHYRVLMSASMLFLMFLHLTVVASIADSNVVGFESGKKIILLSEEDRSLIVQRRESFQKKTSKAARLKAQKKPRS